MKTILEFIFITILAFTLAILTAWLLGVFEGKILPIIEPVNLAPEYQFDNQGKG